jgi:hypothetical protein
MVHAARLSFEEAPKKRAAFPERFEVAVARKLVILLHRLW